jgi:outer membrane lipoprotein-sorting protein
MKKYLIHILLLISLSAFAQDGDQLLKKSDEQWVPDNSSYILSMTTYEHSGKTKVQEFRGFKKGASRNVMIVERPRKIKGSVFLRKEDVIWSYFTTNHRLQKVAYQSLFMGTLLSYGDVLATELSYDYNVTGIKQDDKVYTLTLEPKKGEGGYGKVEVVLDKNTLLPKERKYYALSGILLKTCEFKKIEMQGNRPVRIEQEFYEPLKERKTVVVIDNIKVLSDIPEKYFNENFIKYLGGR